MVCPSFCEHCCSVAQSCPVLCNPMDCSTPGFPVLHYFLEFAQAHVHWVGDAIQLSQPLSPASPPILNLFRHQDLFNESTLRIRWLKYRSFNFSISPSKEYSGLISFRIDWLDLLAVQETLTSVFSNTTVQKHQFFGFQPSLWSNSHIHTWLLEKTIALTRRTFVGK